MQEVRLAHSGGETSGAALPPETGAEGAAGCRLGSSKAVALESQITLRRKKRCSVAAAPRLSLSMVWRRRRYSSLRPPLPAPPPAPPVPEAPWSAAAPSFSPMELSELEPFLGGGGGGARKRGARVPLSAAPPDIMPRGSAARARRRRRRRGRRGKGPVTERGARLSAAAVAAATEEGPKGSLRRSWEAAAGEAGPAGWVPGQCLHPSCSKEPGSGADMEHQERRRGAGMGTARGGKTRAPGPAGEGSAPRQAPDWGEAGASPGCFKLRGSALQLFPGDGEKAGQVRVPPGARAGGEGKGRGREAR